MKPHHFLILILSLSTACSPEEITNEPVVDIDFTITPRDGQSVSACPFPCTVVLENTSTPQSWQDFRWNFGFPGGTFNGREPGEVTFEEAGSYTIELVAELSTGDSEPVTKIINVIEIVEELTAEFTIEDDECFAPCALTFLNTSTNATHFEWDFGDGTDVLEMDNNEDVTHAYERTGTYTVSLKAFNGGEEKVFTQEVFVDIYSFTMVTSTEGTGVKVFQGEDGAYYVVGNTGFVFGDMFLLRTEAGGGPEVDTVVRIEASFGELEVVDACQLNDGSIAILGAIDNDEGLTRAVYARVSLSGEVLVAPQLLEENSLSFADYAFLMAKIMPIGSSDLVIVGTAFYMEEEQSMIYFKRFDQNLSQVNPGVLIEDVTSGEIALTDVTLYNGQPLISAFTHALDNSVGKLFLIDPNGTVASGYPRIVSPDYKTIEVIKSAPDGMLYGLAKLASDELKVFQLSSPDDSSVNWEEGTFNSVTAETANLEWDERHGGLLVIGNEGLAAAFKLLAPDGSTLLPLQTFTPTGDDTFYHGRSTKDHGFIMVGNAWTDASLYIQKTNEEGQVNP